MFTRIALAVLMVSMTSCTALKQRFGTGEETPQLKAARADCRAKAEKEAIRKYQSTISQKEHTRIAFDACMEVKGYNKFGKKIK
ncbi:MAG: hypothetical protein O6704_03260 [Nitrospinae bacterium]|nr:hypothetical protein [Nitrospinota bacterium]MCH8932600.1 hypothetical protein [Nitrospinota bacterium]MCZ6540648.1 hypothetical protein [Nitrospinota bacterium]